jgi:hypothetical protein
MRQVVADAWKSDPKKVEAFCVREIWRLKQQRMNLEAIAGGAAFGAATDNQYDSAMPPAEKMLCNYNQKK